MKLAIVARNLAQEWEAKLQAQQQLQEEYERFRLLQPKQLSSDEKQAIRNLAENLPTLWHAETTTQNQRKAIIRQVIQKVVVEIEGESEHVRVRIEWEGGDSSEATIIRPVAKWTQLSNYPQLCQRLKYFSQENLSTDEIIDCLHKEGFYPPKRRKTFNREMVQSLMRRLGLRGHNGSQKRKELAQHEWWLSELASVLEMPKITLYNWVQRGWVKARQQPEYPKHWIVWADEAELERLKKHRQRPLSEVLQQRWRGEVPSIALCPQANETSSS